MLTDKLNGPSNDIINKRFHKRFSDETINYIDNIFNNLFIINKGKFITYNNDNICYIKYNVLSNSLVIDKFVWCLIQNRFNFTYYDVRDILKFILEQKFNLKNTKPLISGNNTE
jgi:hypothetical protein